MEEKWAPVRGFPGYEVSDHGRVRSLDRVVSDGSRRRGTLLRPGTIAGGYKVVALHAAGHGTSRTVHSLVAEAHVGGRRDGDEVCHNDGVRANNAASNLRWASHAENMRDQVHHGTNARLNRTHCPEGHALVELNLRASELHLGRRACRSCALGRRRAAKRGVPFGHGDADDIYSRLMNRENARAGMASAS